MNRRITLCILLAAMLAFTLYEELTLRPYWLKNHIYTYTVADWLPNLLAPIILVLTYTLLKDINDKDTLLKSTYSLVLGLIIYEIMQLFMPSRTFDHKDIIASIAGGALIYGVVCAVFNLFPPPPEQVSTGD
jgi:glycopeptide antibiotics resistance protein